MTQDGKDPLQESDPWFVQDSKGRTRPEEPSTRTLAHFMPPGLGTLSSITKVLPSKEPQEQPELVEQPGDQALSRDELEKGLDLIQDLLDKQMAESEKRERAVKMAVDASVPWLRPPRNDFPERSTSRHLNRFSRIAKWCDCSDGECNSEGKTGF